MNEIVFFSHLAIVVFCVLVSLKLGRETLLAAIAVQAILANLFVLKQVCLFGFHVTSCEVYTVGCILAMNLLQEYHPTQDIKPALFTYFGGLVFFIVMTQFHLHYTASGLSTVHFAYEEILTPAPRIFLASLLTSALTIFLDLKLFAFLKKRFLKASLSMRIILSACVIQLLDTILFTGLGLYGVVSHPGHIIIVSYLIKVITVFSASTFIAFAQRITLLESNA